MAGVDELTPIVYRELRRIAAAYIRRERPGQTLQATALVHEAYLRLAGALVGTPAYMSPEQLNGQRADTRSDVFGYGVVAAAFHE